MSVQYPSRFLRSFADMANPAVSEFASSYVYERICVGLPINILISTLPT